jgi:hypothetical protein
VTIKSGFRLNLQQSAVRQWRDGKIVKERFYCNKG